MNPVKMILLVFVTLLLALVVLFAQSSYIVQRTVLSGSFLSPHLDDVFDLLREPEVHEEVVGLMVDLIQESANLQVPREFAPYFDRAALSVYEPAWIEDRLIRFLNGMLRVVKGRGEDISVPVYLGAFKTALVSEVARDFDNEVVQQVNRGMRSIPDEVDIGDALDAQTMEALRTFGDFYILFALGTVYGLPILFVVLTFLVGGVGKGIAASGAGFGMAGLAAFVFTWIIAPIALNAAMSYLGGLQLPVDAQTFRDLIGGIVGDMLRIARPIALVVFVAGSGVTALGIFIDKNVDFSEG
jgi:hypothetical protein